MLIDDAIIMAVTTYGAQIRHDEHPDMAPTSATSEVRLGSPGGLFKRSERRSGCARAAQRAWGFEGGLSHTERQLLYQIAKDAR